MNTIDYLSNKVRYFCYYTCNIGADVTIYCRLLRISFPYFLSSFGIIIGSGVALLRLRLKICQLLKMVTVGVRYLTVGMIDYFCASMTYGRFLALFLTDYYSGQTRGTVIVKQNFIIHQYLLIRIESTRQDFYRTTIIPRLVLLELQLIRSSDTLKRNKGKRG